MKKILSYREKLIELANIYKISDINNYIKNKKYLTTAQIEHILKKNNVPIPTEINKSILEIQTKKIKKPIGSLNRSIADFFISLTKGIFKIFKNIQNFFVSFVDAIFKLINFINRSTVKILNSAHNFQVQERKANKIVTTFIASAFVVLVIVSGFYIKDIINEFEIAEKDQTVKDEIKLEKSKAQKKQPENKPKIKDKNTSDQKVVKKPTKPKKTQKSKDVAKEFVLPNLNLKTDTILSLFKDVDYDLKTVRFQKRVKPIYFTQFPKDLDEIKDTKLKKETFIQIVLPLIVAENEKIFDDRIKLKKITSKKMTTEKEKLWLRQKLREYKVKNSNIKELEKRMDIIPVSIALAQAAKESGWGTSRFALEGNAIFGQWTWTGQGIEPLSKGKNEGHKILRFPILRASVKAYKNNLNTHKGYADFREKRYNLRKRNKKIKGLDLTETLDKYAQTGKEYTEILKQIIKQNSLSDFETVQLTNSIIKKELNL